jgi:phosphohistidine phosphatase
MKKLMLLRHAKSSWGNPGLRDFDRPLNGRGERAAPFMGEVMRRHGLDPEVIISSPATRAKRTAQLVADAALWKTIIQYDERIYEATAGQLLELASELPAEVNSALLIGHNPGMENLLYHLTGEDRHLATATLAVLHFDTDDWTQIGTSAAHLELFLKPKELMKD